MKFVCPVCGYVEEFDGEELPADFKCPQCGVSGDRFIKQSDTEMTWAAEHVIGVGKLPEVSEDIVNDLRANFEGECTEVGMYLAMARGRRPLTRRPSTLPSSPSSWARS